MQRALLPGRTPSLRQEIECRLSIWNGSHRTSPPMLMADFSDLRWSPITSVVDATLVHHNTSLVPNS